MDFRGKLILAPLAGVTDSTFRRLCRENGADIVVTEMVSARGLLCDPGRSGRYLEYDESERPVGAQLFGSDPGEIAEGAAEVERRLPPGSRVVFLWEPRSYGCQVDCWPDALLDRFLHLTYLYADARSIAEVWRMAGVTHILLFERGMQAVVEDGFDPVTQRDLEIMDDLRTNYLSPMREWGDAYVLYEMKP